MSRAVVLVFALVFVNAALIALGRGRGDSGTCEAQTCVGLVFDVGGLGDKSFNDSAHRGVMRAVSELGVQAQFIEPADGADRESAVRQLAARGLDIIIAVGFIFTDDVRKLAREFPDVRFACIDFAQSDPPVPLPENLAALNFREQEGSFLVGAIAGLVSKSKTVGMIGGMEIPLIKKFEAGYRRGVAEVCPECEVLVAYIGTTVEAWANPAAGQALAKTQFGRGADIVYQVAGRSGTGVFNAAREFKHWAIGVDSDQFEEAPCCILTSMLKRIDVAVFETIKSVHEGRFTGGEHEFGLAEDGVGFVYDDNNRDRIPADVVERVRALAKRVVGGEIEVPAF
jgi:basic membrane protein A